MKYIDRTSILLLFICYIILNQSPKVSSVIFLKLLDENIDPDQLVQVPGLIESRGFKSEEHSVETNDGYILTVHRIVDPKLSRSIRSKLKPVLLFHGLFGSSADFLINSPYLKTNESKFGDTLGFALVQTKHYDVWLLNARGNDYSQHHRYLNKNDPRYWEFSWEQMALEDLPASISYVRKHTKSKTIGYIGFSQGTLTMFALLSLRPEYADIIQPFIALGPAAFFKHIEGSLKFLSRFGFIFRLIGGEFQLSNVYSKILYEKFCNINLMKYLCKNLIFLLLGFDSKNFNQTRINVYTHFLPSGVSSWDIAHFSQMIRSKSFRRFDYGTSFQNYLKYGSLWPPDIPLERIPNHTKIALFQGHNDVLCNVRDVQKLKNILVENNGIKLIKDYFIPDPDWTHMDFIWGKNSDGSSFYQSYVSNDFTARLNLTKKNDNNHKKMPRIYSHWPQIIPDKNVSKYSIRMMKLRSKLFNEYQRPPMPYEISRAVQLNPLKRQHWDSIYLQNEQVVKRFSQLPCDLDHIRSVKYYPAHPQLSDLMTILRQHGLYRDEHKDIKEEMSRLRALRGKPDKVWRGKNSKNKEKDEN